MEKAEAFKVVGAAALLIKAGRIEAARAELRRVPFVLAWSDADLYRAHHDVKGQIIEATAGR